jgi:LuxR family transcriptional regulator, maltose regulon positive regulatory protein
MTGTACAAGSARAADQETATAHRESAAALAAAVGPREPRALAGRLRAADPGLPLLHRPRLTHLIERAARHRVALVCAPAGAGKTVACAWWAAAQAAGRRVAWLTLKPGEDRAWFWADVCAGMFRARAVPPEATRSLQDASAEDFPLRLAEAARLFTAPVVLVLDNAHELTDQAVLAGLDVLIRHAPPALSLCFSGRCLPGLQWGRLRACGELGMVGAASLACTPDEVDAYRALLGLDRAAAGRGPWPSLSPSQLAAATGPRRSRPGHRGTTRPG